MKKTILVLLCLVLALASVSAIDNRTSVSFVYQHMFGTELTPSNQANELGFDVTWKTLYDESFVGIYGRSAFLFGLPDSGAVETTMRIDLMFGPTFRIGLSNMLEIQIAAGPAFSIAAGGDSLVASEFLFGLGIDASINFGIARGFFLQAGVVSSNYFLLISEDVLENTSTRGVYIAGLAPYVGFAWSIGPLDSYYVNNPLYY